MGYASAFPDGGDDLIIPGRQHVSNPLFQWAVFIGNVAGRVFDIDAVADDIWYVIGTKDIYLASLGNAVGKTLNGNVAGNGLFAINGAIGIVGGNDGTNQGDMWKFDPATSDIATTNFVLINANPTDGPLSIVGYDRARDFRILALAQRSKYAFWDGANYPLGAFVFDSGVLGVILHKNIFVVHSYSFIVTIPDNGVTAVQRYSHGTAGNAVISNGRARGLASNQTTLVAVGSIGSDTPNGGQSALLMRSNDDGVTWIMMDSNTIGESLNGVVNLSSFKFLTVGQPKGDGTPRAFIGNFAGDTWRNLNLPFKMNNPTIKRVGGYVYVMGTDPVSGNYMYARARG